MAQVQALQPDLVVLTGDAIDRDKALPALQVVDVNYPDRSATTILAAGSGE